MCKDKIMWWLSGAFGLDALAHLLNVFGINWTYHLDKVLSLVAFVTAFVIAVIFAYLANQYSKQAVKSVQLKQTRKK